VEKRYIFKMLNTIKKQRRGIKIPLIFFTLIVFLLVCSMLLASLIKLDNYKTLLSKQIGQAIKRDISIEKIRLSILNGLAFEAKGVSIKNKKEASSPLYIEKLTLNAELLPLLKKKVVLKKIVLHEPQVTIKRNEKGLINILSLPEKRFLIIENSSASYKVKNILIKNGYVKFIDEKISDPPTTTEFQNVSINLINTSKASPIAFKLSANISSNSSQKTKISARGSLNKIPIDLDLSDFQFDADIKTDSIQYEDHGIYLKQISFLKDLKGEIKADINLKKDTDGILKLSGNITTGSLSLKIPHLHDGIPCDAYKNIISCDIEFNKNSITVNKIGLKVKDSHKHEIIKVDNTFDKDGKLVTQVNAKDLSLKAIKKYVPKKYISDDFNKVFDKTKFSGTIKITSVSYSKTISRPASWTLELKDVNIDTGENLPPIKGLTGLINLKDNEIKLNRLNGRIRNSNFFNSQGKIFQINSDPQIEFFLNGNMDAADIEYIKSLSIFPRKLSSRLKGLEKMSGNASLTLNARGNIKDRESFEMQGSLDLKKINLSHKKIKPEMRNVNGKIDFTDELIKFDSLNMLLDGYELNLKDGLIEYGADDPYIGLTIESKKTPLENLLNILPFKKDYKTNIKGFVKSKIIISGNLSNRNNLNIKGDISLDHTMILSNRISNPIYLHRGNIIFNTKKAYIKIEKAKIGNSVINLKGEVKDFLEPKINIDLISPYIELDEIPSLFSKQNSDYGHLLNYAMIKARIQIEKAKYKDMNFKEIDTNIIFNKGQVKIVDLRIKSNSGSIMLSSLIDLSSLKNPTIRIEPKILNVDSESLLNELNINQNILTGSMDISGNLSFQSLNPDALKKNMDGHVFIQFKNGFIKKSESMALLSSKLHFDNEFKKISENNGIKKLPYHTISGDFIIHDGIITTNNLSIVGKKVNIAATGRIDLTHESMDLKVSVFTSNTMERIVNKLPFVGNAAVGNDKNLIANFYEVKGKISDPEVTKIPSHSIELNILKAFRKIIVLTGEALHIPQKVLAIGR